MLLEGERDGAIPGLPHAQRVGDLRSNQFRIADAIQRDKVNASGKLIQQFAAEFHGQARLADASRPGQRHQSHLRLQDQLPGSLQLLVPAHQRRALGGQIMRSGRGRRLRLGDAAQNRRQFVQQVLRGTVSVPGVLRQAALHRPLQGRGRLRVDPADRLRLVPDDGRQGVHLGRPAEGPPSRGHFVQHGSEGELVGPEVARFSARLLRRHISERSQDRSRLRQRVFRYRGGRHAAGRRAALGQAEVQDLGPSLRADHDVGGLQVAVHDSLGVRRGQSIGDLHGNRQQLGNGQRSAGHRLPQGLAFDQLHHDVGHASRIAHVVDGDDVGMVERGRRPSFLNEAIRGAGRQYFDGDGPRQPRIARAVHLPHSSGAQRSFDLVRTQPGAARERAGIPGNRNRSSRCNREGGAVEGAVAGARLQPAATPLCGADPSRRGTRRPETRCAPAGFAAAPRDTRFSTCCQRSGFIVCGLSRCA